MNKVTNILIAGVGGQGAVLASRIIAQAALQQGQDIKVSEVHGMAQRGGSVTTQVRIGEKVFSPLISKGEADYLLVFEKLEALRWLDYLKPDGVLIVNDQSIPPMSVIQGQTGYPENIIEHLREKTGNVLAVDALHIAASCGSAKAVNVVLLGALARCMDYDGSVWQKALEQKVPPKFLEINQAAFAAGYKAADE